MASFDEPLCFLPRCWPNGILRDVPVGLADAVVGEAVVRRVDEECVHWVKLAAYFASDVWDVYLVLAFTAVTLEDEPVLVRVETVTDGFAIAEDLIVLKCFKVTFVLAGVLVLVPDEVGFVDSNVIIMGIVLVVHICFLLLFLLCVLLSSLLLSIIHLPLALLPNLSFRASSIILRLFSVSFYVLIVQKFGEIKVVILTTPFPNTSFLLLLAFLSSGHGITAYFLRWLRRERRDGRCKLNRTCFPFLSKLWPFQVFDWIGVRHL